MGKYCYHSNWHNWQLPTQTTVCASHARSRRPESTYVVYVGSRSVCFEPAVVCYLQGDVDGRIPAFPSSMRWSRAVTSRPVSAVPALSRSHPEPVLLSRAAPASIVPAVLRHEPAVNERLSADKNFATKGREIKQASSSFTLNALGSCGAREGMWRRPLDWRTALRAQFPSKHNTVNLLAIWSSCRWLYHKYIIHDLRWLTVFFKKMFSSAVKSLNLY